MSTTMQAFLTRATQKAAADLETALLRLPEDKRTWSPADKARSALDQVAECAMLSETTAGVITSRGFDPNYDFAEYGRAKDALVAEGSDAVVALLRKNVPAIVAAIESVPDDDLGTEVTMPWGPMTLSQIVAYPFWNMSYHEGQINYIASMLGCL